MTLRDARLFLGLFVGLALAPGLAGAQGAQNANVWDGRAHQPAAGVVDQRERQVGVAPSDQKARTQEQDLDVIGRQLIGRAAKDAPLAHTVQPGGVVNVPPNSATPEAASTPSR